MFRLGWREEEEEGEGQIESSWRNEGGSHKQYLPWWSVRPCHIIEADIYRVTSVYPSTVVFGIWGWPRHRFYIFENFPFQ